MTAPPPPEVLEAFGVRDALVPAERGMGRTFLAGDVVLKTVDHEVDHAWVCEVYDAWTCAEVDVAQPLRVDGAWSFRGWGAQTRVPGVTARVADDPAWFGQVHTAFHAAVAGLARPAHLDGRDDAWSYGDRVAWEGAVPLGGPETLELLERAIGRLRPVAADEAVEQVVHGDLGGNVLRDGDRGAVIDWPPYWRPVGWALAVVAHDAVCWDGADPSLLDVLATGPAWPQLLLRAAIYRLATRGRQEADGQATMSAEEHAVHKDRLLTLIEERL